MGAVAVPALEADHPAHAAAHEGGGRLDARIEPAHMRDLEDSTAPVHDLAQALRLLDARRQRLLAQHVLAGLECAAGMLDVVRIGGGHDHRFEIGVSQHAVIVGEGPGRLMHGPHALDEIGRHVADRMQRGVAGLHAAFQMRRLSDRAAPEHPDPQATRVVRHDLGPSRSR